MSNAAIGIVRDRIDGGPLVPTMYLVVLIGFLLNMVDGFDVVAMSAAAPSLTAEWGITDQEKGWILSSTLVGMAIGAVAIAPVSDIIGRRLAILGATVAIGVSMIATGYIPPSVSLLVVMRVLSGLGIGVILASGSAIASEFVPDKYRGVAVTTVVMGYSAGAMMVGPIAGALVPTQGWEVLFIYGGAVTLVLGAALYFALPESVEFLVSRENPNLDEVNKVLTRLKRDPIDQLPTPEQPEPPMSIGNAVGQLLSPEYIGRTLTIWAMYFLGFLAIYFLMSWIPSIFVDSGFTLGQGYAALTQFNIGALIGTSLIGYLSTRMKLAKPIAVYYVGAAIALALVYFLRPENITALNSIILMIGFLLQGGFIAMFALATRTYPTSVRTTGVGWAAGLGRIGGIVSPIVAGYLIASGWDLYSLFLLFSVPLVLAGALALRFKI